MVLSPQEKDLCEKQSIERKQVCLFFPCSQKCVRIYLCLFQWNTPPGQSNCNSFSPLSTCTICCSLMMFIRVQGHASVQELASVVIGLGVTAVAECGQTQGQGRGTSNKYVKRILVAMPPKL